MVKAQTPALGASIVRGEIKAKVKRIKRNVELGQFGSALAQLTELENFIDTMTDRANAKPGGLGKK